MKDKKDIKLNIFETALEIYSENPTRFSVRTVAKELNLKREEVYTHFPSKYAILRNFYQLCFEEYIKQTDEIFRKYYSDAYQIGGPLEKLSAFNNYFIFKRV